MAQQSGKQSGTPGILRAIRANTQPFNHRRSASFTNGRSTVINRPMDTPVMKGHLKNVDAAGFYR